jgi:predicted MFS family arabinose efflux permease
MFLFGPLAGFLMTHLGWRTAFVVLGLGTTALLLPTNWLAPGSPPELAGGARGSGAPAGVSARLADIVPTFRFWCFAAAFFFTPVSNFMVTTHQVAHLVAAGIDPRWAATAFGLVGLLSALGRATFGTLGPVGRSRRRW